MNSYFFAVGHIQFISKSSKRSIMRSTLAIVGFSSDFMNFSKLSSKILTSIYVCSINIFYKLVRERVFSATDFKVNMATFSIAGRTHQSYGLAFLTLWPSLTKSCEAWAYKVIVPLSCEIFIYIYHNHHSNLEHRQ